MGIINWLFGRSEEKPSEPVKPAPCGNDKVHYHWTEEEGWPCPKCSAIAKNKRKEREQEEQAERIATLVANKLRR